jgi:hypothetical protein
MRSNRGKLNTRCRKQKPLPPHIFLATSDPSVVRAGQQRDIAPTILRAMGVDLARISPALLGNALGR